MLFPLSHDSGRLRRQPWVTIAISTLLVAVHLETTGLGDPVMDEAEARIDAAFAWWEEHPYLDPGPRLVSVFGDRGRDARADFHQAWLDQGRPPVSPAALAREQAELDARVARLESALAGHVFFQRGLVAAEPRLAAVFTHLFLHDGWVHLLGNLLFLFLAGPVLEDRFGRGVFAALLLASGVAGAAAFVARNPGFEGPLIGASGAVAGALGVFLVRFFRSRIRFFFWLGVFFGAFTAPAWLVLPIWFVLELATAIVAGQGEAAGGVAYWAHVGGFAFGAAAGLGLRAAGLERPLSPEEEASEPEDAVRDVARAVTSGIEPSPRPARATYGAAPAVFGAASFGAPERGGMGARGADEAAAPPSAFASEAAEAFDRHVVDLSADEVPVASAEPAVELEPEPDPEPGAEPEPEPKPPPAPRRRLRVLEATPLSLEGGTLWLDVEGRGRTRLAVERLEAVALAGVRGLGRSAGVDEAPRPVALLDLVVAGRAGGEAPTPVLRLRGDRFDPRRVAGEPAARPLAALRSFAAALARAARVPLLPPPDEASPAGALRVFASLADYERAVLGANSGPGDPSRPGSGS